MAESKVIIQRPNSANTPPNCAICLGSCSNKCFSDSCMHQFCFKCLLEWSKIKAECPLCKQPFKSIIHNVKSNEEYDEHVVENLRNENVSLIDNEDFLLLPLPLTPHRHEFHVRTTFTVDSRGEHAIQQMLLTHPLTTGGRITIGAGYPSSRTVYPRLRRDFSATSFRRSIYAQNLWVNASPDLTGRYRECSPTFFRNNPAARQRLVPWLNRELNALLYENTQLIMHLVDLIMDRLLRYHICSRTFRDILHEYLDAKTDHFVHEFYSFMRSPFDMIGYDRNVIYTSRPQSPAPVLEDDTVEVPDDNSDDSDVIIVGATNPSEPVTINLVDSNSDSDEPIMVSSSTQVPMPILPPPPRGASPQQPSSRSPPPAVVNLPPKLRHKRKALQDKDKWRWIKKRYRRRSRSSSSSSGTSSDRREKESYRKYKRRKLMKKLKLRKKTDDVVSSSDSDAEVNITSDTDDDKPLIDVIRQKWKNRDKKDKKRKSRREDLFRVREQPKIEPDSQAIPMDLSVNDLPGCSRAREEPKPPKTIWRPSPMDLSLSSGCSRHSVTSMSSSASSKSSVATSKEHSRPKEDRRGEPCQPSAVRPKSDPTRNGHYAEEVPKTTRSKIELTKNGQYTSPEIENYKPLPDYDVEPLSTRAKIKIMTNGHYMSPERFRKEGRSNESGSSSSNCSDNYTLPSVRSEIREVKQEIPGPSTSKPLVLRREHNKWYVFGESDSSD